MEKEEKTKRFTMYLTKREIEMLETLRISDGYHTLVKAIHGSIIGYYLKRFPLYMKSSMETESGSRMTDEEYCVDIRKGTVDVKDQVCWKKQGALRYSIPLGLIKEQDWKFR